VDNALASGIGRRLDGWANRDLNVGKIITLAPNLKPLTDRLGVDEDELKKALTAWGPGKYDATLLHDGKAFRPDGKTAPARSRASGPTRRAPSTTTAASQPCPTSSSTTTPISS
jgi:hypothetical protein